MSSVLYAWAKDVLRHDDKHRSVILIIINALAQQSTVWTPLIFGRLSMFPGISRASISRGRSRFCLCMWTFVVLYFFIYVILGPPQIPPEKGCAALRPGPPMSRAPRCNKIGRK
ncbi:hypothetical protein V1506DRAFT_236687 [Lipomyces tetrasporus]